MGGGGGKGRTRKKRGGCCRWCRCLKTRSLFVAEANANSRPRNAKKTEGRRETRHPDKKREKENKFRASRERPRLFEEVVENSS